MTSRRHGVVKGQAQRFIKGHYQRTVGTSNTYRSATVACGKKRLKHVLSAEAVINRPLPVGAEVHHVDGNRRNNEHRNLVICQDRAYHRLLHARARVVRAGGDPNTQNVCRTCDTAKPFGEFYRHRRNGAMGTQTICKACAKEYDAQKYRRSHP